MHATRRISAIRATPGLLAILAASTAIAVDPPQVSGTFTGNGQAVEITHVYAYAQEEGFYDAADPTWTVLLAAGEVEPENLDRPYHDFPFIEVSFTLTSEFDDEPTWSVLSQNTQLPDAMGSVSGGTYPEFELTATGPDRFAGRVWLPEVEEFFDKSWQYDLTFSAPVSVRPVSD